MTECEKKYLIAFVELLIRDAKRDSLDRALEIVENNIRFEKSFKEESHTLAANVLIDVGNQIEALKGEQG